VSFAGWGSPSSSGDRGAIRSVAVPTGRVGRPPGATGRAALRVGTQSQRRAPISAPRDPPGTPTSVTAASRLEKGGCNRMLKFPVWDGGSTASDQRNSPEGTGERALGSTSILPWNGTPSDRMPRCDCRGMGSMGARERDGDSRERPGRGQARAVRSSPPTELDIFDSGCEERSGVCVRAFPARSLGSNENGPGNDALAADSRKVLRPKGASTGIVAK